MTDPAEIRALRAQIEELQKMRGAALAVLPSVRNPGADNDLQRLVNLARGLLGAADAEYPLQSPALCRSWVKQGLCPNCGGELDTGFECATCEFDAKTIADAIKEDVRA